MRPWKRIKWFFNPHDPDDPVRVVAHAVPVRSRRDPARNAAMTRYEAFRPPPGRRGRGGRWPS